MLCQILSDSFYLALNHKLRCECCYLATGKRVWDTLTFSALILTHHFYTVTFCQTSLWSCCTTCIKHLQKCSTHCACTRKHSAQSDLYMQTVTSKGIYCKIHANCTIRLLWFSHYCPHINWEWSVIYIIYEYKLQIIYATVQRLSATFDLCVAFLIIIILSTQQTEKILFMSPKPTRGWLLNCKMLWTVCHTSVYYQTHSLTSTSLLYLRRKASG